MQTHFTEKQLKQSDIKSSDEALRKCVHCGFCLATCPTYRLLGDELDSPRGRISLIKNMLENEKPPTADVVKHIDRCLSCLGCQSTCPSGVNYMHLIDHARSHIEQNYRRPFLDRAFRQFLSLVLPRPTLFRFSLLLGRLFGPISKISLMDGLPKLRALLELVPSSHNLAQSDDTAGPETTRKPLKRVALLDGCIQSVTHSHINAAARRLLARLNCEVVDVKGIGCCGALSHHLGHNQAALSFTMKNIASWTTAIEEHQLDAIVVTASGCGTMIKDYGHLLRSDNKYAEKARRISAVSMDICEFLGAHKFHSQPVTQDRSAPIHVTYQSPCSMQHGQHIHSLPVELLRNAGFQVSTPSDDHLCCGSAGTYNILQPEIASRLGDQKIQALERTGADIVATGNIGCQMQLQSRTTIPIVHTVELLDWAHGGPKPEKLSKARNAHHTPEDRQVAISHVTSA